MRGCCCWDVKMFLKNGEQAERTSLWAWTTELSPHIRLTSNKLDSLRRSCRELPRFEAKSFHFKQNLSVSITMRNNWKVSCWCWCTMSVKDKMWKYLVWLLGLFRPYLVVHSKSETSQPSIIHSTKFMNISRLIGPHDVTGNDIYLHSTRLTRFESVWIYLLVMVGVVWGKIVVDSRDNKS